MAEALAAVRDGSFVRRLMADQAAGQPELSRLRAENAAHAIEAVDARMHEAVGKSRG
jgi:ketol-acid reductoisomerase